MLATHLQKGFQSPGKGQPQNLHPLYGKRLTSTTSICQVIFCWCKHVIKCIKRGLLWQLDFILLVQPCGSKPRFFFLTFSVFHYPWKNSWMRVPNFLFASSGWCHLDSIVHLGFFERGISLMIKKPWLRFQYFRRSSEIYPYTTQGSTEHIYIYIYRLYKYEICIYIYYM